MKFKKEKQRKISVYGISLMQKLCSFIKIYKKRNFKTKYYHDEQ